MLPAVNVPAAFNSVGVSNVANDTKEDVVGALDKHIALGRSGLRVSPLCLVRTSLEFTFRAFLGNHDIRYEMD